MSDNILEKVVSTTTVGAGGGGILNPKQANRFIDYMWDETVLGKECRTVKMKEPQIDLDKIAVGTRLAKKATEGVNDGTNRDATFTKISLSTVKIRLDWELTTESLEDNIAGDDLEDHVARLMARQLGNDLEDLAINGDTAYVGSGSDLITAFDGWKKISETGSDGHGGAAHVVDAAGAYISKDVFNSALKAMPRKWLQRRSELRWYTSSGLVQDFLHDLTSRETVMGDAIIFGNPTGVQGAGGVTPVRPYGISLVEVPLMSETLDGTYDTDSGTAGVQLPANTIDHGYIELTFPKNRIWGIHRDIVVYREFQPKKDTVEYTVYTRVGVEIEHLDNFVQVENVKVR
jgi:hypothetical protein